VDALRAYLDGGTEVDQAPSGDLALRRIDEAPPALVVTDLQMPGVSGYELAARLKDRPPTRGIAGHRGERRRQPGRGQRGRLRRLRRQAVLAAPAGRAPAVLAAGLTVRAGLWVRRGASRRPRPALVA
jgi:CheY-like chemotaxis protein